MLAKTWSSRLRLVDRQLRFALDPADLSTIARAFVEQRDEAAVDVVDRSRGIPRARARASSCVMRALQSRCFSSRANDSSSHLQRAGCRRSARSARTKALPTTTLPPAGRVRATCSGVEMPKPTASGRSVTARIALDQRRDGAGERIALAGDAGARDQIDEAGGVFAPPVSGGARCWWARRETPCRGRGGAWRRRSRRASSTLASVSRQPSMPAAAASRASVPGRSASPGSDR